MQKDQDSSIVSENGKHYTQQYQPIKAWAEEDRPREKLLLKGRRILTDVELLAILINTGTKDLSAIDLARNAYNRSEMNLSQLGNMSFSDLIKFKGIGPAKAITLIAAFELGRRRQNSERNKIIKMTSSQDIFNLMRPILMDLDHEEFWVVYLNRGNRVIDKSSISSGGTSSTVVDAKIIFKNALNRLASALVLIHNHPSGNLKPSQTDIKLTKKLQHGAALLDISILDHLIVSNEQYYSFADEGLLS